MIVEEKGKLYDVHDECSEAGECELHKVKDEFSGCRNIGKATSCFYCLNKPDHPHIKINMIWVRCELG